MDERFAKLLRPVLVKTRKVAMSTEFMDDCRLLAPGQISEVKMSHGTFVILRLEDFEHILKQAGLGLTASSASEKP